MLVKKSCVVKLRRRLHISWSTNSPGIWLSHRLHLRRSSRTDKKEPIESGPHLEFLHSPASKNVLHGTSDSSEFEEQTDEDEDDDTPKLGNDSHP